MRLLNTETLAFGEFYDREIPPYCILSHRWGGDEVSYKDFRKRQTLEGAGYRKILKFCNFVKKRGLVSWRRDLRVVQWVWIDTCCIDKRSSAELSEAINSMFRYYAGAEECVVYLVDLDTDLSLHSSSWFERGWTLQELLAPEIVVFCDADWNVTGHICSDVQKGALRRQCSLSPSLYGPDLTDIITEYAGMDMWFFENKNRIYKASIAQRMSWAARRKTTRVEDQAYCLLGIFKINMPLIYGEGRRAFRRLQEELVKASDDQSVFAWTVSPTTFSAQEMSPVFALSPAEFSECKDVVQLPSRNANPYIITNSGLQIRGDLLTVTDKQVIAPFALQGPLYALRLHCVRGEHPVYIALQETGDDSYVRVLDGQLESLYRVHKRANTMRDTDRPIYLQIEELDEPSPQRLRNSGLN